MLEFIILGLLYKRALTGYDIKKYIDGGINMFYKVSYGSLYPLLNKLLKGGYVICSCEMDGKREKKIYTITGSGKKAFIKWLEADENESSSIEAFMARVYYYDLLPAEVAANIIARYENKLVDYLQDLIKKKEKYEEISNIDDYYFKLSTLYFGICKLQSIIEWCETVKNKKNLNILVQQSERKEK